LEQQGPHLLLLLPLLLLLLLLLLLDVKHLLAVLLAVRWKVMLGVLV
jgi:hypothetical protein